MRTSPSSPARSGTASAGARPMSPCAPRSDSATWRASSAVIWTRSRYGRREGSAPPSALEINLDARWRGGELARLLDADHAAIEHRLAAWLTAAGWQLRPEVSFSRYGERGSYDLLAFHPERAVVLIVEVKTVVTDLQRLLRQLDVKTRLARSVAAELGWQARAVVPVLVIADTRTARRRIEEHRALFARLSLRGRAARTWLRSPNSSPDGVLLFERLPARPGMSGRQAGRQRVRSRRTESSVESGRGTAENSADRA